MECGYNIRFTIVYKDSQTNISILPLHDEKSLINENISDVKMYEYNVETLING